MPDAGYLTPKQVTVLLEPIKEHRVGRDKKGNSHVEAWEIRAHLNRVLGFGRWSADVLVMDLLAERPGKNKKDEDAVTVGYRAQVRLTVCAPDGTVLATYTEWATGDAVNFPVNQWIDAHDFAVKTAESQAFKRCAMNLGDQFGLSLYRKGGLAPVVGVTLVGVDESAESAKGLQDAAPPTFREPDPEPPRPEVPTTPPGPLPAPADRPAPKRSKEEFRAAILAAETKQQCWHILRDVAEAGWAQEETTNAAGVTVTFNDLAIAAAKGLES